jgi:hypothetical protein
MLSYNIGIGFWRSSLKSVFLSSQAITTWINGLEKSRTELGVNNERRIQNLLSNLVLRHPFLSFADFV